MLCYFITIFINFPPVQNTIPFHGIPKCTHIFAMFLLCIHIFTISGLSLAVLCAFRTFKGGTHICMPTFFTLSFYSTDIYVYKLFFFSFSSLFEMKFNAMICANRLNNISLKWFALDSVS